MGIGCHTEGQIFPPDYFGGLFVEIGILERKLSFLYLAGAKPRMAPFPCFWCFGAVNMETNLKYLNLLIIPFQLTYRQTDRRTDSRGIYVSSVVLC